MLDLLIKGGTIVDGTGAAPYVGDLGITDGRTDALKKLQSFTDRKTVGITIKVNRFALDIFHHEIG